jgi:uncharacterized protein (DUF885 family)
MKSLVMTLLCLSLAACGPQSASQPSPDERLDTLIDRYLAEYWEANPGRARGAGLDGYTGRTDLTAAGRAEEAHRLRAVLTELDTIPLDALSTADHRVDHRLLGQHARVRLFEIEDFPRWRREPAMYLARPQLDAESLQALPPLYAAGRANLRNPPPLFIEAALRSGRMHEGMLEEALDGELHAHAAAALTALRDYLAFLEDELLPTADGPLGAGTEVYEFYLREVHGLDMTADEVHALGWTIYREVEAALAEQAARLDPGRDWLALTEDIRDQHPARDDLLDAYCRAIQRARTFIIEQELVTVPPNEEVRCRHSDPSQRSFSPFGTFRVPAPFADTKVGWLILHPIPVGLTPEREAELLRAHDYTWIEVIAPHEAYPGHHLQAILAQEHTRPLRKIYSTPVFTEGWGLYTEQLMHETGFYTRPAETRLTQLRLQLWRAARIILDSGIHTGRIDYEEARRFLADNIRMEYSATAGEVAIYTYRPSYAIGYMIGLREILDIREAYDGDLRDFHDRMLRLGSIPFPMVRELLLDEG